MRDATMRKIVSDLDGSLTALVTPFRADQVDWTALSRLCERQIDCGTAALVACGSTGEAAALDQSEYSRVIRVVVETAGGRVPVIAGCTAMSTSATVALGLEAAQAGADALLCAVPPYVKPMPEGIITHIRAIAQATKLPIVLYDVPSRSATAITDDVVNRLHQDRLIVGIKDATADLSRPPRLHARCGDGFMQWSGDDATAPAHRAMGGTGCISVTANVTPALCALLQRAWDNADLARFASVRDLLRPLHAALFAESNPIPVKAALSSLGLCTSEVRLPLTNATPATQERLLRVTSRVMVAEQHAMDGRSALAS